MATHIVSDASNARTLTISDAAAFIRSTSIAGLAVTIPDNSVAIPLGSRVAFLQGDSGFVTIRGATGVRIDYAAQYLPQSAGQNAVINLIKYGANSWSLYGDMRVNPGNFVYTSDTITITADNSTLTADAA